MSFSHLLLYASAYSFPVLRHIFVAFPCVIFIVVNCLPFLLTCSFYDGLYNVFQIVNDYAVFLSTIVFHLFKLYVLHLLPVGL
jgi:hypothetical protein